MCSFAQANRVISRRIGTLARATLVPIDIDLRPRLHRVLRKRRHGLESGDPAWVERIGDICVVGQRPQRAQDVIVAEVSAPPSSVKQTRRASRMANQAGWIVQNAGFPSTDAASRRDSLGTDIRLKPICALNGTSVVATAGCGIKLHRGATGQSQSNSQQKKPHDAGPTMSRPVQSLIWINRQSS
jgi:hypothetical protein